MTTHELKAWPMFFGPMSRGEKTFEIRKNDRRFAVGDTLFIREWDPARNIHTGNDMYRLVTYITDFPAGLREGFVVMGLGPALRECDRPE